VALEEAAVVGKLVLLEQMVPEQVELLILCKLTFRIMVSAVLVVNRRLVLEQVAATVPSI
jgi:hypothetical protein